MIAEHNFNCLRAFNDVIVGEDVALCVYHKAGACAFDGTGSMKNRIRWLW